MAKILRDPQVADYIVEREINSEAELDEVRRLYEEGYLVLLKGVKFDFDYPFLNSISFDVPGPPDILHKVKKLGGHKFLALSPKSSSPLDRFVFENIFSSDEGRLAYFQEQVRSGNAQSDALYAKLFPQYVATRTVHTWRFTETMYENLHWDVFGIPEPFHQVRIFTNLASSPRLWRVSHRSDEFVESIYDEWNLGKFAGAIGDDLLRFVNKDVLLGKTPCFDRQPKHHVAFEQGDVWICETRLLAHQIYHGERAFAAMYFSDPQRMYRPELGFEARIQQLHAAHSAATEAGVGTQGEALVTAES
jgi:hypothetical protein